ncbi:MAG: hypothetical protein K6B52_03230 [Clostridiales bacterium]|nr:hypothetical protein [Clostridiales bacterium]
MKSKKYSVICLLLCFAIIAAFFSGCKKNGGEEPGNESVTEERWSEQANEDYETVQVTGVELADIVEAALGDEAKDFDGDFSSLSKSQIEKVRDYAQKNGYQVENGPNGAPVISKTVPSSKKQNEILSKAGVTKADKLSDKDYEKVSKAAAEEGVSAVRDKDGFVSYIITETTSASPVSSSRANTTRHLTTVRDAREVYTARDYTRSYSNAPVSVTAPTPIKTTASPGSELTANGLTKNWVSTLGSTDNAQFEAACATDDGAVAVGTSNADNNGNSLSNYGALISAYDSKGKLIWSDVISGDGATSYDDVAVLNDGSVIAVGSTLAKNLVPKNEYKCVDTVEGVVSKYSSSGHKLWTKIIGGSGGDMIYAVAPTNDGGFVIGGKTTSADGSFRNAEDDGGLETKAFVIKLSSDGNNIWATTLSGSKHSSCDGLAVDSKGNIYGTISTCAHDGAFKDLESAGQLIHYCVAVKIDENDGAVQWKTSIWEVGSVTLKAITIPENEKGCVLAGNYASKVGGNKGTFASFYNGGSAGTTDGALVYVSESGKIELAKTYIGFESDVISDIKTIDGGYAITAYTASANRDFPVQNKGSYDCYLMLLTKAGKIRTYASFAGSLSDRATALCVKGSTAYVAGGTNSGDGFFEKCDAKGNENKSVAFMAEFKIDTDI